MKKRIIGALYVISLFGLSYFLFDGDLFELVIILWLCVAYAELTISSNLEDLEWGVFFGCSRLKNVYCLPEKKTFIWTVAFDISDIEHIILYVPKDLVGIYMKEEPWNKFKEVKPVLP